MCQSEGGVTIQAVHEGFFFFIIIVIFSAFKCTCVLT